MVKYSKEQEAVARALLKKPMDVDELRSITGLDVNDVNEALRSMITLKVVIKRQDNKYSLIDDVVKGVKKERNFHVKMFIEGLSEDVNALQNEMNKLEEKIREDNLEIIEFKKGKPLKQTNNYSMFFDTTVAVSSLKDVVGLIVNYGPSSVELLKPDKINLNASETHELLNDFASAVHYYVGLILQLRNQLVKLQQEKQAPTQGH